MDKMTFASYKFKPSDVIEGLNAFYKKDEENKNCGAPPFSWRMGYSKYACHFFNIKTRDGESYKTFSNEHLEEAITWLREEHDIFYTPGMEVPVEDFDIDEVFKEYEKATRTSDIFCEENLDMVPVARVREALGIAEDSDIFQCIKHRNNRLDTLRAEVAVARRRYQRAIEERDHFGKRLADIRKAAGMADGDPTDLVKYVEALREKTEENSVLRSNLDYFADLAQGRQKALVNLRDEILKVYREIFDCSNGDPEGTDKETLQDILTEYKRVLELKNVAEEKTIKYKELARENEDTAKENKVQWNNTKAQLQWAQKENLEWLKRYEKLKSELDEMKRSYGESVITSGGLCEDLAKEREKVKRMEQKLNEIQDICER